MAITEGQRESDGAPGGFEHVQRALEISYEPRASAQDRQQALQYLEELKNNREAPQYGFALATNASFPGHARLFGLALLETALVRRWQELSREEADAIGEWVVQLSATLRPEDPSYLRLKVASLWVLLAERTWGDTWSILDEMLLGIWLADSDAARIACNRTFVLYILECLSDDICVRDGPIAMLRSEVLGRSLNDIFLTQELYRKHRDDGEPDSSEGAQDMRAAGNDGEGWISRISKILSVPVSDGNPKSVILRALEALKPTVTWISLEAILESSLVDCVFQTLAYGDDNIRLASIELLFAILHRSYNPHFHAIWEQIARSAMTPSRLEMLRRTYQAARTDPDDIDDTKYIFQKKLSEALAAMGDSVNRCHTLLESDGHVNAFYDFTAEVLGSDSLLVSIPVLHSLSGGLSMRQTKLISVLHQKASQMFDTCIERLIRFESLPKEATHPILAYLREDFETLPDQHAFLGNYRRYCMSLIESVAQDRPEQALDHLLKQLRDASARVEGIDESAYSKNAIPVVQLEANFAAIKGGLSGYSRWVQVRRSSQRPGRPDPAAEQEVMGSVEAMSSKCSDLLQTTYQNPEAARTSARTLLELVSRIPSPSSELVRAVTQYILRGNCRSSTSNTDLEEAAKQYEMERLSIVKRLAMSFPDELYEGYNELASLIAEIDRTSGSDEAIRWGYKAIEVVLIQRTVQLDERTRLTKLQPTLRSVVDGWTNPPLNQALGTSFEAFCSLIGLGDLVHYLADARFSAVDDWSKSSLDARGLSLRSEISSKLDALPVRLTNSLLSASSENLKEHSPAQRIGVTLWQDITPAILPNVLALLGHATAFNNENNWSQLSPDLQRTMRKLLVDRFWQSGISTETKDEFAARVSGSSNTYEGFASTVRGAPRQIRDGCYYIIHGMTRFEETFFSLPDLGRALSAALLDDAHWLSTHHLQRIVPLLDRLIEKCPPKHRRSFIPHLIVKAYPGFHAKLTKEWEAIEASKTTEGDNEESGQLGEEMKADSVVRATSHAFITFTHGLFSTSGMQKTFRPGEQESDKIRNILLIIPQTIRPIIQFLNAALRMRDSRCVSLATNILRSIIPFYLKSEDQSSELAEEMRYLISTEVLQTAIMSLNEQHFVDIHNDLAALIAAILYNYAPLNDVPVRVIESLQGMDSQRVRSTVEKIVGSKSERERRALVLGLLEGIRGVRISEMGKMGIAGSREDAVQRARREKGKWTSGGMEVESSGIVRGNTPPEGGLGAMFGEQ